MKEHYPVANLLKASLGSGGCAAKISAADLRTLLHGLRTAPAAVPGQVLTDSTRPQIAGLLSNMSNFEDAAVYKLSEDSALVQTVDFFPPMVSDPTLYGRIAATNALSDVYAMGANPILALGILGFPTCDLPLSVARAIIDGAVVQLNAAGAVLAGGHSIQSSEIFYGLAVTGLVSPKLVLTNDGAQVDDRLLLTKAIGTGVGLVAYNAELLSGQASKQLINSLTELNNKVRPSLVDLDIHGATDVTGYGLIGHLQQMAQASRLSFRLKATAVPVLPECLALARSGFVPAAAYGNRNSFESQTEIDNAVPLELSDLLFDPQTSGGLLLAVAKEQVETCQQRLKQVGVNAAAIGYFTNGPIGKVEVIA
jgi:selenide,water dikinase